jgi:hypothetical protein
MIDTKIDVERVRDELCGVGPKEVLGLLALIMKRENVVYTSTGVGSKRVRRFKANLIGMTVFATEVRANGIIANDPFFGGVDYHVETDEWEFKVRIESTFSEDEGVFYFGARKVRVLRPWFDGDEDDYKHKMSVVRMMGLASINADNVFL